MKIAVQARMGSTRLPGKMAKLINGKPLIIFLLERLSEKFDKKDIVVLTSNLRIDDVLDDICKTQNFKVFRGEEKNVFNRYKSYITENININEPIVRLTGDNLLIDLDLISEVLKYHELKASVFTSTREIDSNNNVIRYLPKGQSVDVFNSDCFKQIDEDKLSDYDREHVIPIFYRVFPVNLFKNYLVDEKYHLSIDTEYDYKRLLNLIGKND